MSAIIAAREPVRAVQGDRGAAPRPGELPNTTNVAGAPPMVLSTPAFPDNGPIPIKYSAAYISPTGGRVSPPLNWTNVPPNTVSLVLHMHDIDSAMNHTTDDSLHWLMWNIPSSSRGLPEDVPQGAQLKDGSYQVSSKTTLDERGYGYRAPAGQRHHYVLELYALDTRLDVMPSGDAFEVRRNVMKAIQGHILAKAVYMGFGNLPPGVKAQPLK